MADARSLAAQAGHPRQGHARRLHRRARLFPKPAGTLRHRQPVSADRANRQAASRALTARPLARRPLQRGDDRGDPSRARDRRRALPDRRTLLTAGALGAAGADGRGGLPVRHGRICRQRADPAWTSRTALGGTDALAAAGDGLFFSPQAELRLQSIMGLQTWNSIARARLSHEPAGRRCGAHRRHRRKWRRHADVHSRRHRRTPGGAVPGCDGVDARCRAAARARTPTTCASARATSKSRRCSRRGRSA